MGKHFISVLGTGEYRSANYIFEGENPELPSKFVQEVLLNHFMPTLGENDRISILVTEKSKSRNWISRMADKEDKWQKGWLTGLGEIISDKYGEIEPEEIVCGETDDELWLIFDKMYDVINEGDEIILDVTHSYRSIPMLALVVMNYAKIIKKASIMGIYYGAFEAKREWGDEKIEVAPIIDLTVFSSMLDWSNATKSFVDYGMATQIGVLYKELCQKEKESGSSLEVRKLDGVFSSMHAVSVALNTSRGMYDANCSSCDNSVKAAVAKFDREFQKRFKAQISEVDRQTKARMKLLYELIGFARDKYSVLNCESNYLTGLAIAKWCSERQMTQQGLTALEETIKTYVCDKFCLNEASKYAREDIAKNMLYLRYQREMENKSENRRTYEMEMIEKTSKSKNIITLGYSAYECERKCYEILENLPNGLASLALTLSDYRNDINHFGFKEGGAMRSQELQRKLEECIREFEEIIDRGDSETLVFVNFSNHPSSVWDKAQRSAAESYGRIVDVEFPNVEDNADEAYILELAKFSVESIMAYQPVAVLCQGEFSLAYAVIGELISNGIEVVAACSERIVEMQGDNKISQFRFKRFRKYTGMK